MRNDPWLDDEQQRTWRTYLQMSAALNARIERDLQKAAGMSHAYYMILAMLSEAPGHSMRMRQLANMVQSSQSRISHAVARLEDFGWVRREQVSGDKRGHVAILTQAGHQQLVAVAPSHAETVRSAIFDPLTDAQAATFRDICGILVAAMNKTSR